MFYATLTPEKPFGRKVTEERKRNFETLSEPFVDNEEEAANGHTIKILIFFGY